MARGRKTGMGESRMQQGPVQLTRPDAKMWKGMHPTRHLTKHVRRSTKTRFY